MTTPDDGGADTADLKNRRKAGRPGRRSLLSTPPPPTGLAPDLDIHEQELPPLPKSHAAMTTALTRPAGLPVLDPLLRRRLTVAELGGHVPNAAMTDYQVSAFDATEQILPWGCKTPITRLLWRAGQHVRRDVYQTYLNEHPELAESLITEIALPDPDSGAESVDVPVRPDAENTTVQPDTTVQIAEVGAPAQPAQPAV